MGWQVDKTWTSDPKKQGKELIFICYLRSTPNSRAGPEHQVGFQPSVLIPGTPWNLLDMEISQAGQRCDDIPHIPCPSHSARRDQRDPVDEPPKLSVIVQLMRGFRHLRTSWLYVACRLFSSYLYIYIYIFAVVYASVFRGTILRNVTLSLWLKQTETGRMIAS